MFATHISRTTRLMAAVTVVLSHVDPASAGDPVPFKGYAEGSVTGTEFVEDGVLLTVVATGKATLLGRFTRVESVAVHPDGTLEGTIVFTAANGDQLYVDASGAFTSETTVAGTYTFKGGTGRFKNATGEASFAGETPDGIHIGVTFHGAIEL
jgi:hypothetical protein